MTVNFNLFTKKHVCKLIKGIGFDLCAYSNIYFLYTIFLIGGF